MPETEISFVLQRDIYYENNITEIVFILDRIDLIAGFEVKPSKASILPLKSIIPKLIL